MKKQLVTFCFFAFFVVLVNAQKAPIKFGKISDDEINLEVYSKDSSAAAVVLCDYETVHLKYIQNKGFMQQVSRNLRIKIFKKEGYEWAKVEINLRKKYDDLGSLKAVTYNLVDGKLQKTKLERSQTFTENINKYWERIKFEMPAVQEGSIIDVEYSISSESFRILDRYFQTEIPIIHSEYRVNIPEYFRYKQLEKGYHHLDERNVKTENTSVTLTEIVRSDGRVTQSRGYTRTLEFQEQAYFYLSKDVPAFESEDFITCKKNYLSCIQFELGSVEIPGNVYKNYTNTWPAIGRDLMLDEDFGGRIRGGMAVRNEIKAIKELDLSDEEKIAKVVNLIRDKITWNGYNGIYSNSTMKAWKEGEGSVGDINLLLTAALIDLGLDSKPVILSTRAHGFIHPAQIILDQFNYVVSSVNLNGSVVLLDATDKFAQIGVLPKRCLNGKGRIIDEKGGGWVNLTPNQQYKSTYKTEFRLIDETIQGKIKEIHDGYAGISKRNSFLNYNSDEEYIEKYSERLGFSLELDSIENKQNVDEPITLNYNFECEEGFENMGNLLLIDPVIIAKKSDNPFKLENREYPVDYSYPQSTSYMASFTIPDDYTLESVPQPKRIAMPNGDASFLYSVQNSGNKIIIVSRFIVKKVSFLPEEYENLKEFYNQIVETHDTKIVLKKNS